MSSGRSSPLAGSGTTIILTTHYLDEAENLADRVGVINRGRIVALDAPSALGGRDQDQATVEWMEQGAPRSARTGEPTALITELSTRLGGEIPGLTVSRPTLEDVCLRLIGEQNTPRRTRRGRPRRVLR